jgi:uncharacterized membrane protein
MSARGGIRRAFIRARDAAEDWVVAARSGLHAQPLVYLARFGEPHEYERFQVTTDRVLGGAYARAWRHCTHGWWCGDAPGGGGGGGGGGQQRL